MKKDWTRFTRCVLEDGRLTETLSPFTEEALDAPAFAELMRHIERIDGDHRTVLMVQVENEVGLLGASRDHSYPANVAFTTSVPSEGRSPIWHTCAPSFDLLVPDLYLGDSRTIFGNFLSVSGGLFIPEMRCDITGISPRRSGNSAPSASLRSALILEVPRISAR